MVGVPVEEWAGLGSLMLVHRKSLRGKKEVTSNSYYISSEGASAYRTDLESLKRSESFNQKSDKAQFEFGIRILKRPFKVLNQRLTSLYPSIRTFYYLPCFDWQKTCFTLR